jgi:hypothetical protein
MRLRRGVVGLACLLVAGAVTTSGGVAAAFDDTVPWYQRPVTVGSGFVVGNGPVAGMPVVSASGRWVAFASDATNLVPGDTNGKTDLFLRDRFHDVTTRIIENVESARAMSPNGRYIVFIAPGEPLTGGGTSRDGVYDRQTGRVTAVPLVTAINNDGWLAIGHVRNVREDLENDAYHDAFASMSKLNEDGTVTSPAPMHQPASRLQAGVDGFSSLDASMRSGVYAAALTTGSPYQIDDRDGGVAVIADMVTGNEQSILASSPPPGLHPTLNERAPEISPNGRYVTFYQSILDSDGGYRGVWDTQTNEIFVRFGIATAIVTNDGRLISATSTGLTVHDMRTDEVTDIRPYDPVQDLQRHQIYSIATDSNRFLTCTTNAISRFDTNGVRDCYLIPIPPST